jgi:hypothetical protein
MQWLYSIIWMMCIFLLIGGVNYSDATNLLYPLCVLVFSWQFTVLEPSIIDRKKWSNTLQDLKRSYVTWCVVLLTREMNLSNAMDILFLSIIATDDLLAVLGLATLDRQ